MDGTRRFARVCGRELTIEALRDGDRKWLRPRQVQIDRKGAGGREARGLDTTTILPPLATTLPAKEQLGKVVNNVIECRNWRELAVLFAQMEERFTTLLSRIRAPWEHRELASPSMDIFEEIDLTDEHPVVHNVDDDDAPAPPVAAVKPDPDALRLKRPRSEEASSAHTSITVDPNGQSLVAQGQSQPPSLAPPRPEDPHTEENKKRRRKVALAKLELPLRHDDPVFAEFWTDREFVLAAVKKWWSAICYTSNDLRNDKEVVLAAVQRSTNAFLYASPELKADKEFVHAIVQVSGSAMEYVSDKLKADREIVLTAVQQDGMALQYSSKEFKADKEIVLAAVKENSPALQYASRGRRGLNADKEIVLAAVTMRGWVLRYARTEFKADREVVHAAVKQDYHCVLYARPIKRSSVPRRDGGETCVNK